MTSDRDFDGTHWVDMRADLDGEFVEDASPGDEDVCSLGEAQARRPAGVRTVAAGRAGVNWLAGAAVALVVYFAFQANSSGASSWDSWWLGGHEPVLLWVICLLMVPAIAILLSATSSKGLGRRWR